MIKIDIMTLFPQVCECALSESIIGRARNKGIIDIKCHQIRNFAYDKHKRVDDTPYGGGNGMVMMADPIAKCFEHICVKRGTCPFLVYMSPRGRPLNQKMAYDFSLYNNIAILCGHYEGVDERVIDEIVDEQVSIGDYVLTGGELPALVFVDSICRMIPGVLSNDECFKQESHYANLLEYPQYTRPQIWRDRRVPEVLLSGHHAKIEEWRNNHSIIETAKHRPDLLNRFSYNSHKYKT